MTPMMLLLAGAVASQVSTPAPSTSSRSFLKTEELLGTCQIQTATCAGYVEGAVDMNAFLETTGLVPHRVCIAPNVGLARVTADVVAWLHRHPEFRLQGAGGAVWAALAETHPCAEET